MRKHNMIPYDEWAPDLSRSYARRLASEVKGSRLEIIKGRLRLCVPFGSKVIRGPVGFPKGKKRK